MPQLMQNVNVGQAETFVIMYLIASAAVQSLVPPDTNSSPFYIWFYKFVSILIFDFKSYGAKIPPPTVTTTQTVSTDKTVGTGTIDTQAQPKNTGTV